jgi:integrase
MASISTRRTASGAVRHIARIRMRGFPQLVRSFERKTDAREWVQRTETSLRESRNFPARKRTQRTVGELIERYRAEAMPASCAGAYGPHLAWWRERLGSYRLAEVRPDVIAKLRDRLLAEPGSTGRRRSGTTVNRYLNTLSAVFTFGESEEVEWVESNPVRRVRRKKEPKGRTRFLSRPVDEPESELERLLAACRASKNGILHDLVIVGLLTGMRENEILCLRRRYVRMRERGIALPAEATKTGEARFVPLVGEALAVVARRVEEKEEYLFRESGRRNAPEIPRFPRKAWKKALAEAKIENFRFHDLRHTHGSYLAMKGASNRELMEALGHKTVTMAARYSHLADVHKREVAERLLEVEGLGGPASPGTLTAR